MKIPVHFHPVLSLRIRRAKLSLLYSLLVTTIKFPGKIYFDDLSRSRERVSNKITEPLPGNTSKQSRRNTY